MTMSAPPRSAERPLPRSAAGPALAALVLLAAVPARAEPVLQRSDLVETLAQGLFCATSETGRMEAPDTEFGWIHIPEEPIAMRQRGSVAPAVLGIGFGLEYTLTGDAPILIRHVVEHPPMPASGRTRQSWESWALGGVPEIIFFQFDLEEELLPGRWTFIALAGEAEVFRAGFDVVPPDAAPHLAGLCSGGDLLALSR